MPSSHSSSRLTVCQRSFPRVLIARNCHPPTDLLANRFPKMIWIGIRDPMDTTPSTQPFQRAKAYWVPQKKEALEALGGSTIMICTGRCPSKRILQTVQKKTKKKPLRGADHPELANRDMLHATQFPCRSAGRLEHVNLLVKPALGVVDFTFLQTPASYEKKQGALIECFSNSPCFWLRVPLPGCRKKLRWMRGRGEPLHQSSSPPVPSQHPLLVGVFLHR